jgi:hypothetical protein
MTHRLKGFERLAQMYCVWIVRLYDYSLHSSMKAIYLKKDSEATGMDLKMHKKLSIGRLIYFKM